MILTLNIDKPMQNIISSNCLYYVSYDLITMLLNSSVVFYGLLNDV